RQRRTTPCGRTWRSARSGSPRCCRRRCRSTTDAVIRHEPPAGGRNTSRRLSPGRGAMSHPFDATLQERGRERPGGFGERVRLHGPGPVTALNVDLSTLTAATDVALAYGDPVREIVDLNFQSGPDPHLDRRLGMYSAVLHHRYGVPVLSVAVLLRREADHPNL